MTGRRLGATPLSEGRCAFHVWAPARERMELRLLDGPERLVGMERDADGYWTAEVEKVAPGARYVYRLDGALDRPDPASRFQPEGVHGPSAVVPSPAAPTPTPAVPLSDYVLYELHVGTFTPEGT
ncbi:MAG: malto-oligosyltrehalose trehalohydrolase, partial [Longimicrobiales bacterium]